MGLALAFDDNNRQGAPDAVEPCVGFIAIPPGRPESIQSFKGSRRLARQRVERQDRAAGPLRGADDSPCVDHRLRVGHQNHTDIDEHIDDYVYEHTDEHVDEHVDEHQHCNHDRLPLDSVRIPIHYRVWDLHCE